MQLLPRLAHALRRLKQRPIGLFVSISTVLMRCPFSLCRRGANARTLALAGMLTAVFRKGMLTHRRYRKIISLQKYIA